MEENSNVLINPVGSAYVQYDYVCMYVCTLYICTMHMRLYVCLNLLLEKAAFLAHAVIIKTD
jgi:hypothetical protein